MPDFKICVIGTGGIAGSNHGPAYARYAAEHPETALAACCDLDLPRAEGFAARFGFRKAYCDYHEMLRVERPDAVCLLVPPALTCALGCDLLRLGVPLLLEKPPGLTTAELDHLLAAWRSGGAAHMVAFNRRYTPLVQALRSDLAALDPGGLQYLRYDFTRVGRADADFSTTAVHGIDTAAFLAGRPYQAVRLKYQPLPWAGASAANVWMDVTFAGGAAGRLEFCPLTGVVTERATLHYHDHTYYLDLPVWGGYDTPGRLVHLERGAVVRAVSGPQLAGGEEGWLLNGFYAENALFFDAVRAGQTPPGGLATAAQTVAIAQAMRERRDYWQAEE